MTMHSNPIETGDVRALMIHVRGTAPHTTVLWKLAFGCALMAAASPVSAQKPANAPQVDRPAPLPAEITAPALADQSTLVGVPTVVAVPVADNITVQPSVEQNAIPANGSAQSATPQEDAALAATSAPIVSDEEAPIGATVPGVADKRMAQVAFERGRELAKLGLMQLAERQWREAVRLAPDWVEAHRALGYVLSGGEQWLEAATQWREVLRLTHWAYPRANGKGLQETQRRAWESEARREFELARAHLFAPWQTPDVVSLGADSRNITAGANAGIVTVMASAMLHPARLSLESKIAGQQTQDAARRQILQQAAQLVRNNWRHQMESRLSSRVAGTKVDASPAVFPMPLTRDAMVSKPLQITAPEKRTKLAVRPEVLAARNQVTHQVKKAGLISKRVQGRWLARIALNRAEQLASSGVPALAEAQLQQAVRYAPNWSQTHRAIARWHAAHEQWQEAASAWSKVLSLPGAATRHEALLELGLIRQRLSSLRLTSRWDAPALASASIVMLGADSENPSTSDSFVANDRALLSGKTIWTTTRAALSVAPGLKSDEGRLTAANSAAWSAQSTFVRSNESRQPFAVTIKNRAIVPSLIVPSINVKAIERGSVAKRLEVRQAQVSQTPLPSRSGRWVLSLHVPAAAEAARAEDAPIAGGAAFDDMTP